MKKVKFTKPSRERADKLTTVSGELTLKIVDFLMDNKIKPDEAPAVVSVAMARLLSALCYREGFPLEVVTEKMRQPFKKHIADKLR